MEGSTKQQVESEITKKIFCIMKDSKARVLSPEVSGFSGADPEIFHGGWLHVLYYTELWGVALLDLFP